MNYKEGHGFTINRVNKTAQTFKYVILKPKNGELLTLVSNTSIYEYHAYAVRAFMIENNIEEVVISGGGTIISDEESRSYYSSSGSFGSCSVYDIAEVDKIFINPADKEVKRISVEGHLGKSISDNGGKTYSMKNIEYEVRNV